MEKLWTEKELASYLAMSRDTLRGWRCRKKGPAYVKAGGRVVRYRESDIKVWLEARLAVKASPNP